MSHLRRLREASGKTQVQVAAKAKCSIPSVRIFEATDGQGVSDPRLRESLVAVYAKLGQQSEALGAR